MDKLRVLIQSNSSRAVTGFGKAMRNLLLAFHGDPNIELIEAANGVVYGADLKTPWESYGTYPNDPSVLAQIQGDHEKEKAAGYGFYTIDDIIQKVKPDVFLGIEDIWAFNGYTTKAWWGKIPCILWTTLDSLPILPLAQQLAPKCHKLFVWASFAEKAMRSQGFKNVETLHGPINYNNYYPLSTIARNKVRQRFNLDDQYVVGFVFKNQLRKSAPNLMEGFKRFQQKHPDKKCKLLLHSDWSDRQYGWDLPKYLEEKGLNPTDVITTYLCKTCHDYTLTPYVGENQPCPYCGAKESMVTKTINQGVSESQLNEIYNVMDVYCHPFTSGGQELPIQEAKAAGLITLVTDYSCGEDAVGEGTGGIALRWSEYREPFTDFIKATTDPGSISRALENHFDLTPKLKDQLSKEGIQYIVDNYSVPVISQKLKKEFLKYGKTNYDFDFTHKSYNVDYHPDENQTDTQWLVSLYKGMCFKNMSPLDPEIKSGLQLIKSHGRPSVYNAVKKRSIEANAQHSIKPNSLEDLLGDEGADHRIAIVIPESAGDVLIINSLLGGVAKLYPDKKIYIITKQEYFDMINDNRHVAGLIPYQDGLDNLLYLEGRGDHKGFFNIAFLPHVGTQRNLNYLHNGCDVNELDLRELLWHT